MPVKQLKLRRADTCAVCSTALSIGATATWNSEQRTVTCLTCVATPTVLALDVRSSIEELVDVGVAGGSARTRGEKEFHAEAERRKRVKEQHPILGRIGLAMIGPNEEGLNWRKGATGEERVGTLVESWRDEGVLVLHDRSVPRSSANIDHIAVTPNGIWVIDPKRYAGARVDVVNKGGWFNKDWRLVVRGRDQTKLVNAMHKQRGHVRTALSGTPFADMPVHGVLCFVDAEWPWFSGPDVVDGIVVAWPKALKPMLTAEGEFDATQREQIYRHVATALPSKK